MSFRADSGYWHQRVVYIEMLKTITAGRKWIVDEADKYHARVFATFVPFLFRLQ